MINRLVILAVAAGITLSAGSWILANQVDEDEAQRLQLAHEFETMSLCVNALTVLERGDVEKAKRLLEQRLAASLSVADHLAASGVTIDEAIPNLREGARRARDYVERHEIAPSIRQEVWKLINDLENYTMQERYTMRDIRSVAIAVEEYSIDHNFYPLQDQPLATLVSIEDLLEPTYIRTLPTTDAWGNDLIYWSDERSYIIVSPGADGAFDQSYGVGSPTMKYRGEYDDPTVDMVFANGSFVQWPKERQN